MRKLCLIISILVMLSSFNYSEAVGQPISVKMNGKIVNFETAPIIQDNRTLVPVRFIAEELGAVVNWDKEKQEVAITKDQNNIKLIVGEKKATVGDQVIELDTKAIIVNSRTYVPIRFISETLDSNVEWDFVNRMVVIASSDYQPQPEKPVQKGIGDYEALLMKTHGTNYEVVEIAGKEYKLSPRVTERTMRGSQNGYVVDYPFAIKMEEIRFFKDGDIHPLTGEKLHIASAADGNGNILYRGAATVVTYTVKNIAEQEEVYFTGINMYASYKEQVGKTPAGEVSGAIYDTLHEKTGSSKKYLNPGEEITVQMSFHLNSTNVTSLYFSTAQRHMVDNDFGIFMYFPKEIYSTLKDHKYSY